MISSVGNLQSLRSMWGAPGWLLVEHETFDLGAASSNLMSDIVEIT